MQNISMYKRWNSKRVHRQEVTLSNVYNLHLREEFLVAVTLIITTIVPPIVKNIIMGQSGNSLWLWARMILVTHPNRMA